MADMFLAWRMCTEGGGWKVRNMFSMTADTDIYIRTGAQGFPVSDGGEEAIGCSKREADKDSSLDPNFTAGSDWAPACILRASGHPGAISSPRTPAFRSLRSHVPRFRHRQTCHVRISGLRDLPVRIGCRSY
jgi:hypothetical protein